MTVLTRLSNPEIERAALADLMQRAAGRAPPPDVPALVRAVLTDHRAERLIPKLIAANAIRLSLDIDALAYACERIERQWWEEALLQYFVTAQASTTMILALFRGVSRSRIERLRRELAAPAPTKPRLLDDAQLNQVFNLWHELTSTVPDPRERYVQLHQRCTPRYPLAVLFAALHIDDDAPRRRASHPHGGLSNELRSSP